MALLSGLVDHFSVVPCSYVTPWSIGLPNGSVNTGFSVSSFFSASLTDNLPISANVANETGIIAPSYTDLFYNRIHLVPERLNLGNVASVQIRKASLWNAFLTSKNLTAFNKNNASGLIINETVNAPYTINPLEFLEYDINVTLDGQATINATLEWIVDAIAYPLQVTGNRVAPFFYECNWKKGFTETWEFLTSVVRKKDSTEQRSRLRIKPRKSISFESIFSGEQQSELFNTLHGWHNQIFAAPIWSDVTTLAIPVSANENTITISEANLSFFDGVLVAIYDSNTFEMIEVETINDDELTLSTGLINDWSAGTKIVPLNSARLQSNQSIQQYTDRVSTLKSRFNCDPITTKTGFDEDVAPLTHNGLEVWVKKINWAAKRNNSSEAAIDTIDNRTGQVKTFALMDFTPTIKPYHYTLQSRAEIKAFKQFILRRKGKLSGFYIPTFDHDFQLVNPISPNASVMDVKDNNYRNFVEAHGARNNIYILRKDGTYFVRKIEQTNNNLDGTQRLSLNSPIPQQVGLDDIKIISLVFYGRLASDSISFFYKSKEVCSVTLNVQSLKEW